MPRNKKSRHPPTEGAYTLRDLYGEIGFTDLKKMVRFEGKPTKDALVDELARSTPLDHLDSSRLKQICAAFGVSGGGKKEDYLARLKKLLKQDAPNVPVALAVKKPSAADDEGLDHMNGQESCASSTSKDKRATASTDKEAASLRDEVEKVGHKRKQDAGITESDLDKKTKQSKPKEEVAEPKARANAPSDDFSIKRCISILNTMGELSSEEKVEIFEVFKDAQDREIFLCAEPAERILWLRRKIDIPTAIEYGYGPL